MLTIRETKSEYRDKEVIRFQPVLSGEASPVFSGELVFAFWEVYAEEPIEAHNQAKENALNNARVIIDSISKAVSN